MKRLLALLGLAMVLAGCASRTPYAPDPFFGRTAVPPPGTGCATAEPPGTPYYGGTAATPGPISPSNPSSSAPQWVPPETMPTPTTPGQTSPPTPPGGNAAPPSGPYGPSGGYGYRGTNSSRTTTASWAGVRMRVTPPDYSGQRKSVALDAARPASWPQPVDAGSGTTTAAGSSRGSGAAESQPTRITRVIQPRPKNTAGRDAAATTSAVRSSSVSRGLPGSDKVIDIMDLPDKGTSAGRRAVRDGDVRPASGTSLAGATVGGNKPISFAQPARYGHDAAYAWLRGRLEYSEIDRRWKLRYIPIDGQTDQYGGSVVLGDTSLLTGLERGDFVEVRGKLLGSAQGDGGFAPVYEVAQIKPL